MAKKKIITGEYDAVGYEVLVDDEPKYEAGNSPYDSQAVLPAREGVGLRQMRRWCISTAKAMAEETGGEYGGVLAK